MSEHEHDKLCPYCGSYCPNITDADIEAWRHTPGPATKAMLDRIEWYKGELKSYQDQGFRSLCLNVDLEMLKAFLAEWEE